MAEIKFTWEWDYAQFAKNVVLHNEKTAYCEQLVVNNNVWSSGLYGSIHYVRDEKAPRKVTAWGPTTVDRRDTATFKSIKKAKEYVEGLALIKILEEA